jgi:ribosomal protein S12 methylthiotransferase accessory factor YcaO
VSDENDHKTVTVTLLFTILGVIFVPVMLLAGYGVQQADKANVAALEAMIEAKSARPFPFTSIDADKMEEKLLGEMHIMEQKLIDRDDAILTNCAKNVDRIERVDSGLAEKMEEMDKRCTQMILSLQNGYPPMKMPYTPRGTE